MEKLLLLLPFLKPVVEKIADIYVVKQASDEIKKLAEKWKNKTK